MRGNNDRERNNESVSPAQILGVALIIGAPNFLIDAGDRETLFFALRVYREWNPNWFGAGKFPVEVSLTPRDVSIGGAGIAELVQAALTSDFAMGLPLHTTYVQPIVLTRVPAGERGSQQVQCCLVTFVRSSSASKRIVFVQGSLDFKQ